MFGTAIDRFTAVMFKDSSNKSYSIMLLTLMKQHLAMYTYKVETQQKRR